MIALINTNLFSHDSKKKEFVTEIFGWYSGVYVSIKIDKNF
jgi:hypothetical protein